MSLLISCPICGKQHKTKPSQTPRTLKCRCGAKFSTLAKEDLDSTFCRPGIPIPTAELPERKPWFAWPGKWGLLFAACGGLLVTTCLMEAMGVNIFRLQEPFAAITGALVFGGMLSAVVASFFRLRAVLTVLVILACTSGGFGAYVLHVRQQMVAPFTSKMAEYCRAQPASLGQTSQPAQGKIIVINANAQQMDDLFYMLPDGRRATSPENVGTIVRVRWSAVEVGKYTHSHKKAFRRDAEVAVFEAKFPYRLLKQKVIQGSDPDPVSGYPGPRRTTDNYGAYPDIKVLEFVLAGAH